MKINKLRVIMTLVWVAIYTPKVGAAVYPFLSQQIVDSLATATTGQSNGIVAFDWIVTSNASPGVLKVTLDITRHGLAPSNNTEVAVFCDAAIYRSNAYPVSALAYSMKGSYWIEFGDTHFVNVGSTQTVRMVASIQFIGDPVLSARTYRVALFPNSFEGTNITVAVVGTYSSLAPIGYLAVATNNVVPFRPAIRFVRYVVTTTGQRPRMSIVTRNSGTTREIVPYWPKSYPGWTPQLSFLLPGDWDDESFWSENYRLIPSNPESVVRAVPDIIIANGVIVEPDGYYRIRYTGWTAVAESEYQFNDSLPWAFFVP